MLNSIIICVAIVLLILVVIGLFSVKCRDGEVIITKSLSGNVKVKNRALLLPGVSSGFIADITPILIKFNTEFVCNGGSAKLNKVRVAALFNFNIGDNLVLRMNRSMLTNSLEEIVRCAITSVSRSYSVAEDISVDPSKVSADVKSRVNDLIYSAKLTGIFIVMANIDFSESQNQIKSILSR